MPEISREQLVAALAKTRIKIEEPEISDSVHGGPDGWQPLWAKGAPMHPAEVADAVLTALGVGQQPDDPEIALMAHTLAVMRTLDHDARARFRNWVDERFVPTRWPHD